MMMRAVSPLSALLLLALAARPVAANLLVADMYAGRLMELRGGAGGAPVCTLFHDREAVHRRLAAVDPRRVRPSSPEQFDALARACSDHPHGLPTGGADGHRQTGFNYPGTKWCGPGSSAQHYDDLGYHRAEDACCREHDHCPAVLAPGQCVAGLCNNALYTKSHCDCDARFRRCLRRVGTETANLIGSIFFNVAQVMCFKEKRPCFPEDIEDRSGRCRMRFHAQARYEDGAYSFTPSGPSGLVSNLLNSFLPFKRR